MVSLMVFPFFSPIDCISSSNTGSCLKNADVAPCAIREIAVTSVKFQKEPDTTAGAPC